MNLIFRLFLSLVLILSNGAVRVPGPGGKGQATVVSPSLTANVCGNAQFTVTSVACNLSSLTSGNQLLTLMFSGTGSPTIAGCGLTWTTAPTAGANSNFATATANAATCNQTISAGSGTPAVSAIGFEIQHTSGIRTSSGMSLLSTVTAGTPFNCPAVTATAGDLVVCVAVDEQGDNGTYTAGTGYALSTNQQGFKIALESGTAVTTGTIQPQLTYSASLTLGISVATIVYKP